jgi:hypothetical protein
LAAETDIPSRFHFARGIYEQTRLSIVPRRWQHRQRQVWIEMNTEKVSLMDVMAVNRDAARKARKAAADKARRQRIKAAQSATAQTKAAAEVPKTDSVPVPSEAPKTLGKKVLGDRAAAVSKATATLDALEGAIAAKAGPVKVTVKQAVLDLFYGAPTIVHSTQDAVAAIQAVHIGMNESSIRVWISDFLKDGSITLVKRDGRKALLKAGKLGKFALR